MCLHLASSCTNFSAAVTKCDNESYSSEVRDIDCFTMYIVKNKNLSSRACNKL